MAQQTPVDIIKAFSCDAVQFGQKACVMINVEAAVIKNNKFILHVVNGNSFKDRGTQDNIPV